MHPSKQEWVVSLPYQHVVFSEMSFPRFDRLVLSDGGPLLIQYISDACVIKTK